MELPNQLSLFINKIQHFDYPINNIDPTWQILFEHPKGQWQYWVITKYKESFTIQSRIEESGALRWNAVNDILIWDSYNTEYKLADADKDFLQEWTMLLQAANNWLDLVKEDWISANQKVIQEFPIIYRKGTINTQVIYQHLPNLIRWYNNLPKSTIRQFLALTSEGEFANKARGAVKQFSANKYFEYCKVIYMAIAKFDESIDTSLTGREMYQRYADGRHEGLLDIEVGSEQEFADWLDGKHPKRKKGGHPWEIRGGRIWLYVSRGWDNDTYKLDLSGRTTHNLQEFVQVYNALMEAHLPVALSNLNQIRTRLCLQDKLGIVPIFESTTDADRVFEEEDKVFDGIYYEELGEFKEQLSPFINWKSLPLLKPKVL